MTAIEFEQKAKAIAGNTEHFKLYTELMEHKGHDVCEIHLYMTDPWGNDDMVFATSNNGDRITDMLLLNELKERLKMFKEFAQKHYDYENRIAIQTA